MTRGGNEMKALFLHSALEKKLNDWQFEEIVQGFGAEKVLKRVEIYCIVNSSPCLDGNHFKEERIRRAAYVLMLREEFGSRLF